MHGFAGVRAAARRLGQGGRLALGGAAAAILGMLMVMTFIDVVSRNLANRPLPGSLELTELMLSLIIFLVLPEVTLRNQHIAITFLDGRLGARGVWLQRLLSALIGATMFGITGWQLWVMAARVSAGGEMTPTLQWSYAPILQALSLLSYATAAAFLLSVSAPASEESISLG